MFKIGCHLSTSNGLYSAAKTIVELGGSTFQYFSRNPRGSTQKAWDQMDFEKFLEFAKENNITTLLTHAPYTLNPCSAKLETREFAHLCLTEDLKRLKHFDESMYVFHPGSHTTLSLEEGIKFTTDLLNNVVNEQSKTFVLLETMSGKGTEIGKTFEELKQIIDNVEHNKKLGVCFDTCHVFCAGYDIVNDLDGVLKHFDEVVGINRIKAIHLNDSKEVFNSRKDRHAKIGEGEIGLETMIKIINHPLLKNIPFFLETPNENEGYKEEIELLKSNKN